MPVSANASARRRSMPTPTRDAAWALVGVLITAGFYLYAINREASPIAEPSSSTARRPEDPEPQPSGPVESPPSDVEPIQYLPPAPPASAIRNYVAPPQEVPTRVYEYESYARMAMPPLPGVGRLAQPIITMQWIESYDEYCIERAELDAAECAYRKELLERMRQFEVDLQHPWVLQMQELLAKEIEASPMFRDLVAYDVRCNTLGCLVFVAMNFAADRHTISWNLAEQFSSPNLSREMQIPADGRFGDLYPDGSTQWEILAMERLQPLPQAHSESAQPNL